MAKIVILGDAHLGASSSSDIIHDYFEKFYNFFFNYCVKHNITEIIQEGDLFDRRKEVHFNTLYRANKYFFSRLEEHDITLHVIAGNHDILYNNTSRINAVILLKTPNMRVVDLVPKTVNIGGINIDMIPWINAGNYRDTFDFVKNSTSEYAVGHFEFANFPMHPGTVSDKGMDHNLFAKYRRVYSGHYHTISTRDNVIYTGTPSELSWNDWNDTKGFWVLDTETHAETHVRNPYTLFEKVTYTPELEYDFTRAKDKYVKLVVADRGKQKTFDIFLDALKSAGAHDIKIIENSLTEAISDAVSSVDIVSTQKMILDVVDNLDTALDKSILKKNILELYAEAMSISNQL